MDSLIDLVNISVYHYHSHSAVEPHGGAAEQITLFTVSLIVEGDQLDSMQPEDERIGIGRVDACGRWVCAEQLAAGVLDELLGVATT